MAHLHFFEGVEGIIYTAVDSAVSSSTIAFMCVLPNSSTRMPRMMNACNVASTSVSLTSVKSTGNLYQICATGGFRRLSGMFFGLGEVISYRHLGRKWWLRWKQT